MAPRAAELVCAQKLQPVEPLALIRTQLGQQPGRRLDLGDPRKARQSLRQLAQPLAAEPTQPGRGFEGGQARHFTGRNPELARGGQVLRVVQLDECGHDRLGAIERERHMSAVLEPTEYRAVMRQRLELARHVAIAQPGEQRAQHGQQGHALAVDLDPEIEREPPPAALLQFGGPFARAIDDAMAETVLEFDPPAFAF